MELGGKSRFSCPSEESSAQCPNAPQGDGATVVLSSNQLLYSTYVDPLPFLGSYAPSLESLPVSVSLVS